MKIWSALLLALIVSACSQPAVAPSPTPPAVVEFQLAPTTVPTTSPPGPLAGGALLKSLQQGGYVIFFRHGATYRSQLDTDQQNLENCATQRNLDESGQAQARAIGAAFQAANIPVGTVLASPYCRTRHTAELAFGRVTLSDELINPFAKEDEAEVAALGDKLARLLSESPAPGTNTILVGHTPNLEAATGLNIIEGEAAVFAPHGNSRFTLIGRVLPDDWAELADQME